MPNVEEDTTESSTAQEILDFELLEAVFTQNLAGMADALRRGADINHQNAGALETPLHFAASQCGENGSSVPIVQWLLDHGADPNAQAKELLTPLHWAAKMGQVEVVRTLLAAGAEPHPRSERGVIPFYFTTRSDDDVSVSKATREAIAALLPNPPHTNILAFGGPIVFGKNPEKKSIPAAQPTQKK